MFGLGKKKLPANLLQGFIRVANEAIDGLGGLLEGDRLVFKSFELRLSEPDVRQQFVEKFRGLFSGLSRNPDNWTDGIRQMHSDPQNTADNISVAALAILTALIKTNLCCKIALAYPQDDKIKAIALDVVSTNMNALDLIILGNASASPFDNPPSTEVLNELLYAKRFLEGITGAHQL